MKITENMQVYWVWADMIGRCTNPKHPAYKNYGGRGITVSEPWRSSAQFLKDMMPRPEGLMLERRDNNLGYSKENCYCADRQAQNLNKRIYKTNKAGVRGVEKRSDQRGYRVRLRRFGKIVLDMTLPDFFEACCIAISYRHHFAVNRGLDIA